jgi:hypothetical protein
VESECVGVAPIDEVVFSICQRFSSFPSGVRQESVSITAEEWSVIKEKLAQFQESVYAKSKGTGIFIDLSCPSCKSKLLAQVTLQQQS